MRASYFASGVDLLAPMSVLRRMHIATYMPASHFARGVDLARICLW